MQTMQDMPDADFSILIVMGTLKCGHPYNLQVGYIEQCCTSEVVIADQTFHFI